MSKWIHLSKFRDLIDKIYVWSNVYQIKHSKRIYLKKKNSMKIRLDSMKGGVKGSGTESPMEFHCHGWHNDQPIPKIKKERKKIFIPISVILNYP